MYGLKRVEYDEHMNIKAVEFYPDISSQDIYRVMVTLGLSHVLSLNYEPKLREFRDKASDEYLGRNKDGQLQATGD